MDDRTQEARNLIAALGGVSLDAIEKDARAGSDGALSVQHVPHVGAVYHHPHVGAVYHHPHVGAVYHHPHVGAVQPLRKAEGQPG